MKTLFDIKHLLRRVKYKAGWTLIVNSDPRGDVPYLQVMFEAPDAQTGKTSVQKGRKWQLSYYMTDTEVVVTAFKAFLAAEEHECRENFFYQGEQIFSPHLDVDCLASNLADQLLVLDSRPSPENQT